MDEKPQEKISPSIRTSFLLIIALTFLTAKTAQTASNQDLLEPPRLTPAPTSVAGTDQPKMSLNGTWRFNPSPSDGFWKNTTANSSGFSDIEVPAMWAMQGFEVEKDKAAAYLREFVVPFEWKSHRVKLRCDAVYSDATVWINGQRAGQHIGGFTPFEFDITELLKADGKNTIALAVKNESLADILASGTQYADHQLGGITRQIYLFAVPNLNIASMHVNTVFDQDYNDATLEVLLELSNESDHEIEKAGIEFQLTGPKKKRVSIDPATVSFANIAAGDKIKKIVKIPVSQPKKWDAEHPDLYLLKARLKAQDKILETLQLRFGFRQVEVQGNQLFVNNHPVKLRGICRHETHPLRSRSLTPDLSRKDAELFRNANINYIRTSHYPPAEDFINACDELGLFVEEEAPLCWVGHGANKTWQQWDYSSSEYLQTIVQPTLEMIQRDRSHPCVIIWSLANESLWSPNFEKSFELAHRLDPTRPKSFHDQTWNSDNPSNTQIANQHYPGTNGPDNIDSPTRPILFGEYCHLETYSRREIVTDPGVRNEWSRGFYTMWEKMYAKQGCLGGAVWSGIDDIFHLPSGRTTGYGPWGPLDGWRRTKPEYWHFKKVYSPIKVVTKSIPLPAESKPIKLKIENRHDFTNLNEITIEWKLERQSGRISADIPPHSLGTITIPLKNKNLDGKKLSLQFFSPRGFTIDTYLLPIGNPSPTIPQSKPAKSDKIELIHDDKSITVKAGESVWTFDHDTGQIKNAEIRGQTVLTSGPTLMVLPLTGGKCEPTYRRDIPPLNDTCTQWKAANVTTTRTPDGVEIKVDGQYKQASGTYKMRIDNAGRLTVDYSFKYTGETEPLQPMWGPLEPARIRQMGIVFDLPKTCDTLAWKRNAPWTVYPKDHIGRPEGNAKAFATAPITDPRIRPQWLWSLDSSALGTNDFRSTKRNIFWASLKNSHGFGILINSDSSQSTRSWVDDDSIRLLVADYSTAGRDATSFGHLAAEQRPLTKNSTLQGTVNLQLIHPAR